MRLSNRFAIDYNRFGHHMNARKKTLIDSKSIWRVGLESVWNRYGDKNCHDNALAT